jgi:hypothetical protein
MAQNQKRFQKKKITTNVKNDKTKPTEEKWHFILSIISRYEHWHKTIKLISYVLRMRKKYHKNFQKKRILNGRQAIGKLFVEFDSASTLPE